MKENIRISDKLKFSPELKSMLGVIWWKYKIKSH